MGNAHNPVANMGRNDPPPYYVDPRSIDLNVTRIMGF